MKIPLKGFKGTHGVFKGSPVRLLKDRRLEEECTLRFCPLNK